MATRPIKISIIGDDSALRKTLRKSAKSLENYGKNVAKMGATAGLAFAGVAAGIATKGVTAFADFEKGMNEVLTLLPDAGEEAFGELSDQVKSFSKEFGVLPDEAIPSLYSALSAGVPKDNVFEFMEVAQKAAKGGVTQLETAVDALSSVVNAYGTEAITATESSDLLLTAVRLGKTTFEEMAAEVYKVAPIAASVGVPFENLTASIAVLTSQGVPTAQSATMLKGALAELAKEGTKADTAFREFAGEGLATFLEGGGTFEEALMGLAAQAEASGVSVLDMFGSVEAGQAVLSLTSDGGAAFSSVLDEMGNAAGATDAAFATMDTGMSASFDRIKANLSVLAIDIGEKLAPHVATATEFILEGFQKLQPVLVSAKEVVSEWAAEVSERLAPAMERAREVIEKVVDWVRTFIKENPHAALAALGVLVASVVVPAVLGLVAAVFSLISPVVLVVAALAALAAGAVYAYENFETFRDIVDAVADFFVATVWPALKTAAEGIVTAFEAVIDFFQDDFVPICRTVADTVTSIWRVLADFFSTYVLPIIRVALEGVMSVLGNLWDVVKSTADLIKALFSGDFAEVWRKFRDLVGEAIQAIVDLFIALPVKIFNASRPLLGKFALIVSDFTVHLVGKILKLVQAMPDQIVEFLGAVAQDIINLGKDIGSWLIDGLINAIKGAAGAVGNAVKDLIPSAGDIAGGIWGGIKSLNPFGGDDDDKPKSTNEVYAFNPETGMVELVPQLARGGIVRSPTLAMIGEKGPEAVVPLNRGGIGATFNITVHAGMGTDGHQVGNQIVSALKQWERANGSLPLNVSAA